MKALALLVSICFFLLAQLTAQQTDTFKERLKKATAGDFIVTQQGKHYSLLLIHFLSADTLVLEEIATPELPKLSWQAWLDARAPGHSSWVMYEIDLTRSALIESYSFSQKKWLYLQEEDYLLVKLLNLPLTQTPIENRKRIGPPPLEGERDHRALWNPPVIAEGKKKEKTQVRSFQTQWPEDASKLAGCQIELYFDASADFSLPCWMEIQSPHYTFKIRTIDSGKHLVSPLPRLPKRAPLFIGKPEKK